MGCYWHVSTQFDQIKYKFKSPLPYNTHTFIQGFYLTFTHTLMDTLSCISLIHELERLEINQLSFLLMTISIKKYSKYIFFSSVTDILEQ